MISDIRLQNFRSYKDETFEFDPGVNIIVGPNASGKTNLLEAILIVARGSSYRAKDSELINHQSEWCRLEANTQTGRRIVKMTAVSADKIYELDGKTYKRLMTGKILPVILFEPNHLLLLTGSPDLRRGYLDDLIEQINHGYGATRRHYKRVLTQRNSLLKKGLAAARAQVFVWNLRLSELGGQMVKERAEAINQLNKVVPGLYQNLSKSKAKARLEYESKCNLENYESDLMKRLEAGLERDCLLGYTTAGPHRDNLKVYLNDQLLENAASRGETRSLVMALKVAELKMIEAVQGRAPMILLDDVFSELDGSRRRALTQYLQKYQTFITTTDADLVVRHFTHVSKITPLKY